MDEVAMPNFSPIAVQTPNARHSINCFNLFIPQYKNYYCKHRRVSYCFIINLRKSVFFLVFTKINFTLWHLIQT